MDNTLNSSNPIPDRILPKLDPDNIGFWTSGHDSVLRINRCQQCRHYIHPPTTMCPVCESFDVRLEGVSGSGTVVSYTINRYRWRVGFDPPYCVALVELDEQPFLRLVANIVDMSIEDISVGMRVAVGFQQYGEIFVPVFARASIGS